MVNNAVEWHDLIAEDFDSGYARSENFKDRLDKFCHLIKSFSSSTKRVIDLGCGAGIFSLYAASLNDQVIGIDGSDSMISICKKKAAATELINIDFKVADITKLSNETLDPADLIICSSVLEYIDNLESSVTLIDNLLRPGGTAIVSMPNKSSFYRKMEKIIFSISKRPKYYEFVKNIVTADEMTKLFSKHGLRVSEKHYFSKAPLIAKILPLSALDEFTKNLFVVVVQKPMLNSPNPT